MQQEWELPNPLSPHFTWEGGAGFPRTQAEGQGFSLRHTHKNGPPYPPLGLKQVGFPISPRQGAGHPSTLCQRGRSPASKTERNLLLHQEKCTDSLPNA